MPGYSYQLYSSRNFPPLADTLRMVASAGYSQVEGFGGLFADDTMTATLVTALGETGLTMPTAHFGFDMVQGSPSRAIDIARQVGIETIFVPVTDNRVRDAAGWLAFGRALAEAGKPFMDAGLRFGWHNHAFEFADLGSEEKPLDLILEGSEALCLELDIAWVQVAGEDPLDWISRYAGRIVAAHIKDIAPEGQNADEDGWADVGHGVLDWTAIAQALGETDVRHLIMEHDNPSNERRFAERSIAAAQSIWGPAQ